MKQLLLLCLMFPCAAFAAGPSTGVNMLSSEPLFAGGLQTYAAYRHTAATRRFDDFRPARNPDSEYIVTHTFGVGANYSAPRVIPGEWVVSAMIPVMSREFRLQVEDDNESRVVTDRLRGLGDIAIGARARYLWWVPAEARERGVSLSLGAIAELPTGARGATREGLRLPRDLQLGRGATSLTFAHIGSFTENRLELIATTAYTWHSVGVGRGGYDFGNEFRQSFEFKYRVIQEAFPGNTMFLMLALAYENVDYDRDKGVRLKGTGHQALIAQPKIQWHPRPWWELKAVFDVTIWRNTHRIQLADEVSFRLSVAWRFST